MKAIKICTINAAAIEAALAEINGSACQHAYTEFSEIQDLARYAESAAKEILPYAKDLPGARWAETSGAPVARSYRHPRKGTTVVLERRSKDWYLVSITTTTLWEQGGGPGRLTLTKAQDEAAKAALSKKYSVRNT